MKTIIKLYRQMNKVKCKLMRTLLRWFMTTDSWSSGTVMKLWWLKDPYWEQWRSFLSLRRHKWRIWAAADVWKHCHVLVSWKPSELQGLKKKKTRSRKLPWIIQTFYWEGTDRVKRGDLKEAREQLPVSRTHVHTWTGKERGPAMPGEVVAVITQGWRADKRSHDEGGGGFYQKRFQSEASDCLSLHWTQWPDFGSPQCRAAPRRSPLVTWSHPTLTRSYIQYLK